MGLNGSESGMCTKPDFTSPSEFLKTNKKFSIGDIIKFKIDKNKGNCGYYVNNQFYGTIF